MTGKITISFDYEIDGEMPLDEMTAHVMENVDAMLDGSEKFPEHVSVDVDLMGQTDVGAIVVVVENSCLDVLSEHASQRFVRGKAVGDHGTAVLFSIATVKHLIGIMKANNYERIEQAIIKLAS